MHFDCLVLGSGPAGFYAALSCAKNGYSVALVEKSTWGGTGFRDGCLPVKTALDRMRLYEKSKALFHVDEKFRSLFFPDFFVNNEKKMKKVEGLITDRLRCAGVQLFHGNGLFHSAKVYETAGKRITAETVIIATGTQPSAPEGIALDSGTIITHREALRLDKIPNEMIIIGGNVEGIEFSSLFSALGVRVTVLEQDCEILPGNDRDLLQPVFDTLKRNGVKLRTETRVLSTGSTEEKAFVELKNGERLFTSMVLVTGCRKPNLPEGLKNTGVIFTETTIPVNEKLETNVPGVFAVGDVNGIHGMAHTAIQQGMFIVDSMKGRKIPLNYENLPRAMFTLPEVAGAGKQEWELLQKNIPYKTVSFQIADTWRGFSKDIQSGIIKLVFSPGETLAGIWMSSENASEILSFSGLLLGKKVSKDDILRNLFIHPTLGEGILEGTAL